MQPEFERLQAILERRLDRGPVYYYPNPGNWGDALIREGTRRFFEDIGLEVRTIRKPAPKRFFETLRRGHLI